MTTATAITLPTAHALWHELDVIAGDELGDVLDAWPTVSVEQADRLSRYLTSELGGYGMLSVEKARECGQRIGSERREAFRVLAAIEKQTAAQS